MSIPLPKPRRKIISALLLTGIAGALIAATPGAEAASGVDLYRVPEMRPQQLERIPKNLARWHMGASLILVKDNQFQRIQVPDVGYFEESVFLSDNSALTYAIPEGTHEYIIDLGRFMNVSRFFLNNQSAAGSVELLASDTLEPPGSNRWIRLSKPVRFEQDRLPSIRFPDAETRYILVRLNIESAGLIGNFGATGSLNITQAAFNLGKGEETNEVVQAESPVLDYDFASTYTGSRIAYVSGGPIDQVHHLLDEDPTTTYELPEGEEAIIIIDLRKQTEMRAFTAEYNAKQPGLVQIYMIDSLPSYFDAPQATGVATLTDEKGHLARAELAAAGNANFDHFMAAQKPREVVRVPTDYFQEIKGSYTARVTANKDRVVQVLDRLTHRYVIFRFIPESMTDDYQVQSARYTPGNRDFRVQQAQTGGTGISFGQLQVIGDVNFDDIVFTLESEPGEPGGPPEDPPDTPPVISE